MSLGDDIKAYKVRLENVKRDGERAAEDLAKIQGKIKSGETTGNALDDFCLLAPSGEKFLRELDGKLEQAKEDLVLLVHEEEIQISCSITHGEYDWRQNYTVGTVLRHEWRPKSSDLLLHGRFAEQKYRDNDGFRRIGDELVIDAGFLWNALYSAQTGMFSGRDFGDKYHFFVGEDAQSAIMTRTHNWHGLFGIGEAFKLIEYTPSKRLKAYGFK